MIHVHNDALGWLGGKHITIQIQSNNNDTKRPSLEHRVEQRHEVSEFAWQGGWRDIFVAGLSKTRDETAWCMIRVRGLPRLSLSSIFFTGKHYITPRKGHKVASSSSKWSWLP